MTAVLGTLLAFGVSAAERNVSSAVTIARVTGGLMPGDVLIMADGTWKDQAILFQGKGTAEKPDRLWRPLADTPLRGAAAGDFRQMYLDMDGHWRGKMDVGADQISDDPATRRPLTAADVGPSWMDWSNGSMKPRYPCD